MNEKLDMDAIRTLLGTSMKKVTMKEYVDTLYSAVAKLIDQVDKQQKQIQQLKQMLWIHKEVSH